MALEVAQFLQSKFSNLLKEAENDTNRLLQSRFRLIEASIKEEMSMINTSTVFHIHGVLCLVIDALCECRVFAYQHKPTLNKGLLLYNGLAEWWFSRNMKKRLGAIKGALKVIKDSRVSNPPNPRFFPSDRQTYPAVNESDIVGFDHAVRKIEDLLMPENRVSGDRFTAIGIFGMGGSGKTALAQKVFNSPKVKEVFDSRRIWVSLWETFSDGVDVKVEVVKYILEALGDDVDELTSDLGIVELLERLRDRLRDKRYLIVLDDVWQINEWYEDLGYSLPEDDRIGDRFSHGLPKGKGGAIIVTSRLEQETKKMVGVKNLFHLDSYWSEETCGSIFDHHLNKGEKKAGYIMDGLEKLRGEIHEKCDGLPLASKILAEIIPSLIPVPEVTN
ncbi:hypothetical protein F0562_018730 [Nyssa sinensis]|uniref:NB-ARC domain-containing protein n=1 Tax=Nyssa sinensis TaxID=561372 RepID=A0A5J4ZCL6_9ASTE|nr:hypothetical protein F0562_018730 [Nyssa sinensis]